MVDYWTIVVIGGPIILGAALIWAMTHNRMSRREKDASDAATRRVRHEQSQDDQQRSTPKR